MSHMVYYQLYSYDCIQDNKLLCHCTLLENSL